MRRKISPGTDQCVKSTRIKNVREEVRLEPFTKADRFKEMI